MQRSTFQEQAEPLPEELAARIRDHCIEVALRAYEEAGIQGLCAEGRWETAIGALRNVDLEALVRAITSTAPTVKR